MIVINISKLYGIGSGLSVLRGKEMAQVKFLENAWLEIDNGLITGFGEMSQPSENDHDRIIDAQGQIVLPSFIDCHTHTVFAKPRDEEFVDRIKGLSYEEIANKGGGILNSARTLGKMSEDDLFRDAQRRVEMIMKNGTGALEIKSGYGLDLENELKMLRVIRRLNEANPIPIKSTFLGAHALPPEYKNNKTGYVDRVVNEMIPEVARQGLAEYIDVFCEQGYFDLEDTRRIVEKGNELGLKSRLHVNQFNSFGAIQLSKELGVTSVEHLEVLTEEDLKTLKDSDLIPVSLPACSFFLSIPYTPVRKLIDEGLPVVLATDFNPGSSPISDLHFVMSLASVKQDLLPEESLNALTVNAAHALEIQQDYGSIASGKVANLNFYSLSSLSEIPYYPGAKLLDKVMINGQFI